MDDPDPDQPPVVHDSSAQLARSALDANLGEKLMLMSEETQHLQAAVLGAMHETEIRSKLLNACLLVQIIGLHYTSLSKEQTVECTCMSCLCDEELSKGWDIEERRRARETKYSARTGAQMAEEPGFRNLPQASGYSRQPVADPTPPSKDVSSY